MQFNIASITGLLVLTLGLSACSQGRESLLAGSKSEVWQTQTLCTNVTGQPVLGCFDITLNLTNNEAYFDVLDIDPEAASTGYRVLARPYDSARFEVLADNINITKGGSFSAFAVSAYIEDYEEWIVELTINYDQTGLGFQQATPGNGLVMARAIIDWPELYQ